MFIQRYCVFASPTEQAQLARVARQGTTPQKIARRARLVWMLSHQESPLGRRADAARQSDDRAVVGTAVCHPRGAGGAP